VIRVLKGRLGHCGVLKDAAPLRPFYPVGGLSVPEDRRSTAILGPMARRSGVRSIAERIEDAMREVGTLLIAFAPLDAALSEGRMPTAAFLLLFLGLGLTLFVGALLIEKGRTRGH